MERVLSRRRYLGKKGGLEECRGSLGRIQKKDECRRRQEKIDIAEERDFRRGELPGKFTAKMLYGWDDKKFEDEYLKKLEKNWKRWKEDRQIDESEHSKIIEEKMKKENEKIRRRDWRTGHFSGGEILKGR